MNDRQRQRLLSRVERVSRTIGESVPEEVTVQGTTIDVREFVMECHRLETVPAEERERLEEVKRLLRRERLARRQRLARDDSLSHADGEELARSIHGLDRAIRALEGLDEPDIEEQLRQKKLEDARELLALVR